MSYLLYYNPDSANLPVRMALTELGADFGDRLVPRSRAERTDDFFTLNPSGLLPVLIDEANNAVVSETAACLLYLADQFGALAPAQGRAKERAEFLKWLFFLANTLHPNLLGRWYSERHVERESAIPSQRRVALQRAFENLTLIEKYLSSHEGRWFLPSGLSVCDFYLGCCLRWAQIYPVGDVLPTEELVRLERLAALLAALENRPSVRNALAGEGIRGPAFLHAVAHLPARQLDPVETGPSD